MKKVCLVAFNGELMCFAHVLLNALDFQEKGYDIKIVIEGSATSLVPQLAEKGKPFHDLYEKCKPLIDMVCHACSAKMGVLEAVKLESLPLGGELRGHPALSNYIESQYEVITF